MFNKQKMSALCVSFALSLMAPIVSFAVTIDDFLTGEYTLGRDGTPMPYTIIDTQFDASGLHILGGQRDVTFEKISGSTTQPYVTLFPGIGASYNSISGCTAFWTQHYGMGADLNSDFTANGGTSLMVNIFGGDMASPPTRPTPFTVTLVSGTGTASHTIQITENKTYLIDFNNFPGVDLTDIDQVSYRVEQNPTFNDAIDFAIDFFGTDADISSINDLVKMGSAETVLTDRDLKRISSKLCSYLQDTLTSLFDPKDINKIIAEELNFNPDDSNTNSNVSKFLNKYKNQMICPKNKASSISRDKHFYKEALFIGIIGLFDEILFEEDEYIIDFNAFEMVDGKKETVLDYIEKLRDSGSNDSNELSSLRNLIIAFGGKYGYELID